MAGHTKYYEEEDVLIEEKYTDYDDHSMLVVYNDDVNTFDWVIHCLMEVCGHTFEQDVYKRQTVLWAMIN